MTDGEFVIFINVVAVLVITLFMAASIPWDDQ
jgi:hypothetical protein